MGAAPRQLLPLLLLSVSLTSSARSEEVGYSLDAATGLFWQVELSGDDGATSASQTLNFPCCDDNDATVLGHAVGIVDPTFTPETLTHLLQPAPLPLTIGVLPLTLDVAGSLSWRPPSPPPLMTGESAPMATGALTSALFTGTLATPFDSLPFGRSLLHHLGGDTALRRFSGTTELGPPRLRLSSASELLDSLEIDEGELPGVVEMRSPYEVVLTTSPGVREAGSVSYTLGTGAGLFWEITISANAGGELASSVPLQVSQGLGTSVAGDTSGIVDPVFTPDALAFSFTGFSVENLDVGAHPVSLDLSGSLAWSPSGPSLSSGQGAPMPTGDASGASFVGTLTTPFGSLPVALGLPNHLGGDMTLVRPSGMTELPPRLQVSTTLVPLDALEIDEADQSGRVDMRNPYEAVVGSAGGISWSIEARVFFNDTFYMLDPAPPNGAVRDVTWSLRSEVLFNDTFYRSDPRLTPSVPALDLPGRVALAALLLASGLAIRRLRRNRGATAFR